MKKLFINLIAISLVTLGYSQGNNSEPGEVELEGVTVSPFNLTYITTVKENSMPEYVYELESKAARYDIRESEVYDVDIEVYEVMFSQNNGSIMATYDKNGRILDSFEKFTDVTLPFNVRNKIFEKYPGWVIHKDAYLVSYYRNEGVVNKVCKVQLRKDGKRKNIKIDLDGNSI